MKNTILTTALLALTVTTGANAAGVEIQAGYEDRVNGQDAAALVVRPFTEVGGYTVGVRVVGQRDVTSGTMYNFFEPQVGKTFKIAKDLSMTATGGLGLLTTESDSHFYGSAQLTANYKMTDKFSVGTGVRYRNTFEKHIPFESMTYYVGVGYQVLPKTNIALVGYSKNIDENSHGYYISVTQTF